MLLSHDSFLNVVETSWATCCSGNSHFGLAYKLKTLKQNLKVWNKEIFGHLKIRISEADQAVLDGQQALDANPSKANLLELKAAKSSLHNW